MAHKRVHQIQLVEGAGWREWPWAVRIDGALWLNALGKPHSFKTPGSALKKVMKHLCVRIVEVLPPEKLDASVAVNS